MLKMGEEFRLRLLSSMTRSTLLNSNHCHPRQSAVNAIQQAVAQGGDPSEIGEAEQAANFAPQWLQ
jgi:hypothetical protein